MASRAARGHEGLAEFRAVQPGSMKNRMIDGYPDLWYIS